MFSLLSPMLARLILSICPRTKYCRAGKCHHSWWFQEEKKAPLYCRWSRLQLAMLVLTVKVLVIGQVCQLQICLWIMLWTVSCRYKMFWDIRSRFNGEIGIDHDRLLSFIYLLWPRLSVQPNSALSVPSHLKGDILDLVLWTHLIWSPISLLNLLRVPQTIL